MSEQCGSSSLGGGRCELPENHAGRHRKRMNHYNYPDPTPIPGGFFEWDDAEQSALASQFGGLA